MVCTCVQYIAASRTNAEPSTCTTVTLLLPTVDGGTAAQPINYTLYDIGYRTILNGFKSCKMFSIRHRMLKGTRSVITAHINMSKSIKVPVSKMAILGKYSRFSPHGPKIPE